MQITLRYRKTRIDRSVGYFKYWRVYEIACPNAEFADRVVEVFDQEQVEWLRFSSWLATENDGATLVLEVLKEYQFNFYETFSVLDNDPILPIMLLKLKWVDPDRSYRKAYTFHMVEHNAVTTRRPTGNDALAKCRRVTVYRGESEAEKEAFIKICGLFRDHIVAKSEISDDLILHGILKANAEPLDNVHVAVFALPSGAIKAFKSSVKLLKSRL